MAALWPQQSYLHTDEFCLDIGNRDQLTCPQLRVLWVAIFSKWTGAKEIPINVNIAKIANKVKWSCKQKWISNMNSEG